MQTGELKASLTGFDDLSEEDLNIALGQLLTDARITAAVVRSGFHGSVGAFYNVELAPRKGASKDEYQFARLAIEEARRSVPEQDGRPHPKVGAVVVKHGQVLSSAHRGEAAGNHAEFIALEKKLSDEAVAGATVYTTLEPCTTRNHPKIPCATRLIERKVARVVIGMLDPDPRISGRGQRGLRSANIITEFFPHDLMIEVEELNREFSRHCEQNNQPSAQDMGSNAAQRIQDELRKFAEQRKEVLISPSMPSPEYPLFQVHEVDAARVVVNKLSSSQPIGIPLSRVSEILWAGLRQPPTLILNGRLQWVTIPSGWTFFAEAPASVDGYLGFAKVVSGLQDAHVRSVEQRLRQNDYEAHWFRKEDLPAEAWQIFYGADGRYLAIRNNKEALILAVRRKVSA